MRRGGGGNQTLLKGKAWTLMLRHKDKPPGHDGQQFRTSTHETCATEMKGLINSTYWPRDMIIFSLLSLWLQIIIIIILSENSKPILCLKRIWDTNCLTHLLWKVPKQ